MTDKIRKKNVETVNEHLIIHTLEAKSFTLDRKVKIDLYLPSDFTTSRIKYPTLILNDGQDATQLKMTDALSSCYANGEQKPVVIAVHAGDRMNEYGTAGIPDYKGRGNKAHLYTAFIMNCLMPYLKRNYRLYKRGCSSAIAGFSLGGLSAFDIGWKHADAFNKVGVFSGSFWWHRSGQAKNGYMIDRIMHDVVSQTTVKPALKFWLEAGTEDEKCDRTNNGVIDAIEDTLDMITELKQLGFEDKDITYLEIEGGQHNFDTWSEVFPEFLKWCLS
ncbi:MAG: alpha/beta hydrolase-fold protein [Bacteroidota bacterium]